MLGSFLELSVWTRNIAASVAFYQALGLDHAPVGETWSHGYGVLTDGRLFVGLHDYEFDSPSLTFVRPGISRAVEALETAGIAMDFAKTADSQFNEAGFRDPAGQVVTLLEARTFSPPWLDAPAGSVLGYFEEYRYPATDPAGVAAFWEKLGAVVDRDADPPRAVMAGVTIAPRAGLRGPELVFRCTDTAGAVDALRRRGLDPDPAAQGAWLLRSPEGLALRVEPAD